MGLVLILIYISLNLLSPGDVFPGLAPYRPLLVLAILSLPTALVARLQAPELGKLRAQLLLVTLFFGFAICSWLPHGWLGGGLVTVAYLGPNVLMYFLGVTLLRSPFRLQLVKIALLLVAIFVMSNGLMELAFVKSTGLDTPYVMAGHAELAEQPRIRGLGMLGDPNVFGQYLLMIMPMLFVTRKDTSAVIRYVVAVPTTILLLVGVYWTGSRGAEMGVAVLLGLHFSRRFKTAGAVISAGFGTILLLAVNALRTRRITMSGGMDRLAIWSDGLQYFKHSPIYGIGAHGYTENSIMTAHNTFLLCAAELGMVGYFLWMSMIVVTFVQLSRVPKVIGESNPSMARWAEAMRLSLGVYMFTSFFLSRAYELPLFLLLGMSGAVIATAGGDEAIPLRGTMWPLWSFGLCVGILILIYVLLRLRAV